MTESKVSQSEEKGNGLPGTPGRAEPDAMRLQEQPDNAAIALKKGLVGAKPEAFCWQLFALLGLRPDDDFVDVFAGTGVVSRAWEEYRSYKHRTPRFSVPALLPLEPSGENSGVTK